jgi:hypothetical protein
MENRASRHDAGEMSRAAEREVAEMRYNATAFSQPTMVPSI